jgi:branched-chain amino acid transport system permease protein
MLGAYVGLTTLSTTHNFWLALIAAPVVLAILGGLIEVVFFRRIYQRGHLMQVLLTFVILFAALIAAALVVAWRKSRIGAIVRAGVTDREMLALLGIDLGRVFTGTFAFGAALAGLAGVVVGPYLSVYPGMDESILVLVLVVVVVGGLGSIEGAIVGSLLVGLANAFGPLVLGGFEAASIFAVMGAVLLLRPRGLLGLRQ